MENRAAKVNQTYYAYRFAGKASQNIRRIESTQIVICANWQIILFQRVHVFACKYEMKARKL